ncbi:MAG: endolytic transglycosylase MltG [Oscillospiraceae bacterium]
MNKSGNSQPNGYELDDNGKTQEMDSVQIPKLSGENSGITPKDEFIDMNSADDLSKTLRMDSVIDEEESVVPVRYTNPVKKRKRKKKQTNHTRTMGQVFLGAVISVCAIFAGSLLAAKVIEGLRDVTGMAKRYYEYDIVISESMTTEDVIDMLHSNGMILNAKFFRTYVNYQLGKEDADPILVGPHTVNSNMSYGNLLAALTTEKRYTETVKVLIPEGSTAADIGKLLEENYVCRAEDFEKYYSSKLGLYDFEEGIPTNTKRFNALEGYLFPDTYEFYVIDDLKKNPNLDTSKHAKVAATTMYKNFEVKMTDELTERMNELGMTLDETIILASLIQREGTNEDNMSKISSVFHNRMNSPEKFPQLQSDTTYTYIERCINPKITSSNIDKMNEIIDAYDTYKCEGLPAGAICNPGLDAIKAALYPANTDYFYFLASKDGVFYYAKTLAQHEQNIIDAALRDNIGE